MTTTTVESLSTLMPACFWMVARSDRRSRIPPNLLVLPDSVRAGVSGIGRRIILLWTKCIEAFHGDDESRLLELAGLASCFWVYHLVFLPFSCVRSYTLFGSQHTTFSLISLVSDDSGGNDCARKKEWRNEEYDGILVFPRRNQRSRRVSMLGWHSCVWSSLFKALLWTF